MTYFKVLLVVHIFGAIIGIGPSFVWPIAGPKLAKGDPQSNLTILGLMDSVTRAFIAPVLFVTQPLSGVLLIFQSGRNRGFFDYEWLWIAVVLYIAVFVISIFDTPILGKLIDGLRQGEQESPAFKRMTATTNRNGIILGVLTVTIMFLMVWKPGEG